MENSVSAIKEEIQNYISGIQDKIRADISATLSLKTELRMS
jgi:hypothetical protein